MVVLALPPPLRPPRPRHAILSPATDLTRIYNPDWLGPLQFSSFGPRHRFDHHRAAPKGPAVDLERRTYYAAGDLKGWVVEVFGDTGVIAVGTRRVALIRPARDIRLLDLRDDGALAVGSVAALASIPDRAVSQAWARWFYDHPGEFGAVDGVAYYNAHNNDSAYGFFERAEQALECLGHLPLADAALRAPLRRIAAECNTIVEPY